MSLPEFTTDIRQIDLGAVAKHVAVETGLALHKHYPGYVWRINVDPENGIVNVWNKDLSLLTRKQWGFTGHLSRWNVGLMVRLAGELLERFNVSRAGLNEAEMHELAHKPLDQRGPELD